MCFFFLCVWFFLCVVCLAHRLCPVSQFALEGIERRCGLRLGKGRVPQWDRSRGEGAEVHTGPGIWHFLEGDAVDCRIPDCIARSSSALCRPQIRTLHNKTTVLFCTYQFIYKPFKCATDETAE